MPRRFALRVRIPQAAHVSDLHTLLVFMCLFRLDKCPTGFVRFFGESEVARIENEKVA